jgi:hypothetical protein
MMSQVRLRVRFERDLMDDLRDAAQATHDSQRGILPELAFHLILKGQAAQKSGDGGDADGGDEALGRLRRPRAVHRSV